VVVNGRAFFRGIPNGARLTLCLARCTLSSKDADNDLVIGQGGSVSVPCCDEMSIDVDGAPSLDRRWRKGIFGESCGRGEIVGMSLLDDDEVSVVSRAHRRVTPRD
jgi:hypothetical protein